MIRVCLSIIAIIVVIAMVVIIVHEVYWQLKVKPRLYNKEAMEHADDVIREWDKEAKKLRKEIE